MSIRNPILLTAAAIFLVLLIIIGSLTLWVRGSLPDYRGSLRLLGLEAPVNIIRDSHAVPHIFAARETDAYYALGFVHASDRLWQMDLMRRLAAGRLSEIFGDAALSSDKMMRTLGLHQLATEAEEQLPPAVRDALQAYANGVNAWIEHSDKTLPIEFITLRYRPELWQPADSVAWGKLMAWQLSGNMREELLRAELLKDLPLEAVDQLFKSREGESEAALTTPPKGLNPKFAGLLGEGPTQTWASNFWSIAPDLTSTGGAILANDPHLSLSIPITWYLARIESPKLAVRGASAPGVPFFALGQNKNMAWGITNMGADVQDLLIATLDPEDATTIVTADGTAPITIREETIKVRGSDPVTHQVRLSPFGPIISDVLPETDEDADDTEVLILAFTALEKDDTSASSLFAINHARDWADMDQALSEWTAPPVNVAYADKEGRIARTVAGNIPIREHGEGKYPKPLSLRYGAWREHIAYDALPKIIDPEQGWVANANEDPAPDDYPIWIAAPYEETFRSERLQSLLATNQPHTIEQSVSIQADITSNAALELLPLMMTIKPQDPMEADLFADLRQWDGTMQRDRSEPLVFAHWARELTKALFEDELGEAMGRYMNFRPSVLRTVLTDHQGWCDNTATDAQETCQDTLRLALRETLIRLRETHGENRANWRWGNEHKASLQHPLFSRIPLMGWFGDASQETDGGPFTLNRGDGQFWNETTPFAHTHGAGYRAVYDLANPEDSRFIIATGPSGNPLSPYYASMVDLWREGSAITLSGSPETLSEEGIGVLTLRPAPE